MKWNWRSSALLGAYGTLLALLYHDALQHLLSRWNNEDYSYCYLVPLVVAFLLWSRRAGLQRVPRSASWWGLLALLPGLGLFWLGELGGEFFTLFISLWLVAVGLLWLHLGGALLLAARFPLLLSLAMFPPPNIIHSNLSLQLKLISSRLGVSLMRLLGMSAYREGNVIDIGFTQLQVVDACSGLRYLFPIILLGLILAYFFRGAWWKKLLLVLTAIPLVVLANGLRIAATGYLYQFWGKAVAEGFFHGFAGWFTFMFAFAVLLPEMWLLKRLGPPQAEEPPAQAPVASCLRSTVKKRAPWTVALVSLLLLLATLTGAQGIEFREKVPVKQPLAGFPLQIGPWQGQRNALEQQFIDALDFADYLLIDYYDPQGHVINLYVAYYDCQRKGESIHSPSSCLPGGGWVFNSSGLVTVPLGDGDERQAQVNRAFIQRGGFKQLTYYWFPQRGRIVTGALEMKLWTFWDALIRQRTDGSLVRLVTPIGRDESVEEADRRLQEMTRRLGPLLEEYLPGKKG
jgi:exosortase D (VPLPA-CTERM-specific)